MEFRKYVTLTRKEFETIPGRGVTKPAEHYRGQIIALLSEVGAEGYGMYRGNIVFMKRFKVADGSEREVRFTIQPVLIQVETRRRGGKKELTPQEATSWYLLWKLLEAKIAAIKIGITDVTNEFMANITLLDDKTGREIPFGEAFHGIVESGRLSKLLQLEELE